ncbi:MAG: hypothetical protein ACTSXZ_04030, partial [Alphaproteobacteria bacterium]
AHALFAVGKPQAAAAWIALIGDQAAQNAESAVAWRSVWPLGLLALPENAANWDPTHLAAWWQDLRASQPEDTASAVTAPGKAQMLYTLLETFGMPVDDAQWTALLDAPRRAGGGAPSAAVLRGLGRAATAHRTGEAVLLALIALGQDGPMASSPAVMGAVVSALISLGLEGDARALAIEAAIAAGI